MKIRISLGLVAESTGLILRQAISHAAAWGCRAIVFEAVGDMAPDRLGETARRDLRNLLKSNRLELAAINVPLRRGLDIVEDQQARLDFIRKAMTLAGDIGGSRVIVPLPALANADDPREPILRESLQNLGRFGDRHGRTVALEAGLDPASDVVAMLNALECGSLAVAYDPMNWLANGHDPIKQLTPLLSRFSLMLARDGRTTRVSGGATELPLGAGEIDWISLFATIAASEWSGPVCVRRLSGGNALADLQSGITFLRRFLPPDVD
jgi:sugar phosphate isomerase/epimerase